MGATRKPVSNKRQFKMALYIHMDINEPRCRL